MTASHAPALRTAYLAAFDEFATDPSDLALLPEIGNVRYAREILGLLVGAGLLAEQDVNGEQTVWQVANPGTYDSATRAEAVATIDAWLSQEILGAALLAQGMPARRRGTASKRNPAGLPLCLCGCGIMGKSDYRPGHDARHAGEVARAILGGADRKAALANLSPALAAKALAQVERGNAKVTQDKRNHAASSTTADRKRRPRLVGRPIKVKVGRWIYDGEVSSVTVGPDGNENANSEVVALTYRNAKGNEFHAQVDSSAWKGAWSFAD